MAKKKAPAEPTPRAPRFAQWITDSETRFIADALSVTVQAVRSWRNWALGHQKNAWRPDPGKLQGIILLSKGRLTAADIYPPEK